MELSFSTRKKTSQKQKQSNAVWPEGGNFPVLWDFWPKRGDRFSEMYKRERERLVHTFTHERGSLLAHVFPQDLVHERE